MAKYRIAEVAAIKETVMNHIDMLAIRDELQRIPTITRVYIKFTDQPAIIMDIDFTNGGSVSLMIKVSSLYTKRGMAINGNAAN